MCTNSDYELALKLQTEFQENGNDEEEKMNLMIAINLQKHFDREYSVENAGNALYYADKKNLNKDNKKSLIDPSWEIIDPTPDVHVLFVTFDKEFFWNKLQAVCVDWSKRMTTCAGVCSYSGRKGICKITLSEPLLKLRPRKDLVETLLHEMIHAYLFVTHTRDVGGHGPEFHKHMYRINNEAGTRITVYHDFHDEVELYQQHWWKCNGPCQNRKPYYGIVRRATNRAPSANDLWWADHARTCGGQFIKIKEPEKTIKTKRNQKVNNADIRKYIKTGSNKENLTKDNVQIASSSNNPILPGSSNIATTKSKSVSPHHNDFDYSVVRNHWLNKYNDNTPSPLKRPTQNVNVIDEKRPRYSESILNLVLCPVCNKKCPENVINNHLDECIKSDDHSTNLVNCEICNEQISKSRLIEHMQFCLDNSNSTLNKGFILIDDDDDDEILVGC